MDVVEKQERILRLASHKVHRTSSNIAGASFISPPLFLLSCRKSLYTRTAVYRVLGTCSVGACSTATAAPTTFSTKASQFTGLFASAAKTRHTQKSLLQLHRVPFNLLKYVGEVEDTRATTFCSFGFSARTKFRPLCQPAKGVCNINKIVLPYTQQYRPTQKLS